MRERDRLVGVVQSLTVAVEATRSKPVLNQLVSIALLEASECLVREGFETARLGELGVTEAVAYFLDAKCQPPNGRTGPGGMPGRRAPYLRLVGS
ncbi:MAG: hypothetical protein QOF41_223 [Methylobacteriaceae bacterium]|nr:hypothetical protein [Methylobacteriaceae bacterium]